MGVTDEDILGEITNDKENNDEEEDDDEDTYFLNPLLTTHEALQSIKSLWTFFSSLSSTNDAHFHALDYAYIV